MEAKGACVLMLDYALLQHRVNLSVGFVGEHERVERC